QERGEQLLAGHAALAEQSEDAFVSADLVHASMIMHGMHNHVKSDHSPSPKWNPLSVNHPTAATTSRIDTPRHASVAAHGGSRRSGPKRARPGVAAARMIRIRASTYVLRFATSPPTSRSENAGSAGMIAFKPGRHQARITNTAET